MRAAGGIVVREAGPYEVEILLVHRPAYDDWTFPKGKANPGESDAACALREVEEETGLRCELGDELPEVRYVDGHARPKVVRYFVMRPLDGAFSPHAEIDDARWLPVEQALAALTYERDRALLRAFAIRPS